MVLALFFNFTRPPAYEAVLNLAVGKTNRQQSDNYQYDEYYNLQAINFVSETVHSWFISPALTVRLKTAPLVEIRERKLAGQNIEIVIKANSQEEVKIAVDKTKDFLKTEVENLILTPDGKPAFTVMFYPVLISQKSLPTPLVGLAGLIIGMALALVYLKFLDRYKNLYDHNH